MEPIAYVTRKLMLLYVDDQLLVAELKTSLRINNKLYYQNYICENVTPRRRIGGVDG